MTDGIAFFLIWRLAASSGQVIFRQRRAGIHNYRPLWWRKISPILPERKAAAYGSRLCVRERSLGQDDEIFLPHAVNSHLSPLRRFAGATLSLDSAGVKETRQ